MENDPHPENIQSESTPSRRKSAAYRPVLVISIYNWYVLILILISFVFGLILGYFLHPNTNSPSAQLQPQPTPTGVALTRDQQKRLMELIKQQAQHYLGDSDAAVLMFEFGDFQ